MKQPDAKRAGLAIGAIGTAAFALWLLLPDASDERVAQEAPAVPAPVAVAMPAEPPPPPPPSSAGLKLHGLLGRGAVIAGADGRQQFFAVGREVAPGLRVARIEAQAVILASTGGELRLGFDGAGPNNAAGGGAAPAPETTGEAALRDATLRYRLGLALAGTGRNGFVVRPGVSMPALERAGLRPGDVILSVNGSGFDEERMLELAWQIDNTPRTEFEVARGGRRLRLALNRSQ